MGSDSELLKMTFFKEKDEFEELGISFKMPEAPRLTENPFTGEQLDNLDAVSMTSSRASSRSSRMGRDGDETSVTKKRRRNARRQFLLERLNLSKQNDQAAKELE